MLEFKLNKAHIEMAKAEVELVTGETGELENGCYKVDTNYTSDFNKLGFTKAIYENGKLICDLNERNKFMDRRSHLLPAGHPAMTHPKLARAMVNLSNAKREILDPFCGAGGILIEAGLMGLKAIGFDIDGRMLEKAKKNIEHFGIRNYGLQIQDAASFSVNAEAVVTDLPYGKSTVINDEIEKLYFNFLINLKKNKIKKAVIGFPDFCAHKKLIEESGFKIKMEFSYYLHKSLSKRIVVLS